MERGESSIVIGVLIAAAVSVAAAAADEGSPGQQVPAAADNVVEFIEDPQLRLLLEEVLARNPAVARLQAEAAAAAQRVPQVGALPDPTASLTWFAMAPETRVGPQRFAVSLMQRLPWFGTLEVDEQAALWDAVAGRAAVEAARLEALTAAREAYHELQFLAAEEGMVAADRATLEHYAELALARYASGAGRQQAVIKLQAEITRASSRLLEVAARRAAVTARINGLRDRPPAAQVPLSELEVPMDARFEPEVLARAALDRRPEVVAARAAVEAAALRVESSKNEYRPELVFGLNYVNVGRRDDAAGLANPPEDNGRDILGLTGGMSVPLWRSALAAGVEEGVQRRIAAEQRVREISATIASEIGDLAHRTPLLREQLDLYDNVLVAQAQQSLESAESAYASGTASALDLLDAERVSLQVRVARARTASDLAAALARLEGVLAGPLEVVR